MAFTFHVTELPKMTLLMVIGHSKEALNKQIASVEAQIQSSIKREFFFELVMKQNNTNQTAYIRYLEVSENEEVPGGIQKITLPRGNYVTFAIPIEMFDEDSVHQHIRTEVDAYFNTNDLIQDPSNVFALFEETEKAIVAYLPFRRK